MNFITAYFIYVFLLLSYGKDYLPNESLVHGIWTNSTGIEMGLQNGDKILSIGDVVPESYRETGLEILLSQGEDIVVERNGREVTVPIRVESIEDMVKNKTFIGLIKPRMPYVVGAFVEGSIGETAGLQIGDSVVGLNGTTMLFFDQYLEEMPKYAGEEVQLTYFRAGRSDTMNFLLPESGKIGVQNTGEVFKYYEIQNKKYTMGQALAGGFGEVQSKLNSYVRQFKLIFNPKTEAYKEVGGFLTILKQYDNAWNWRHFWEFTAFLSIMLGFLNILPIPALDGGHVIFTLVEWISGRKPSIKVLEYAQMVGFFLLLALLLLANGNDVLKAFGG